MIVKYNEGENIYEIHKRISDSIFEYLKDNFCEDDMLVDDIDVIIRMERVVKKNG